MMGCQSRQMSMIFVDIESLIPENHLLRKIDRTVSFNFIYDLLAPYYPATGRPSVRKESRLHKRMVNVIFFYLPIYYSAGVAAGFGGIFAFVNRSNS